MPRGKLLPEQKLVKLLDEPGGDVLDAADDEVVEWGRRMGVVASVPGISPPDAAPECRCPIRVSRETDIAGVRKIPFSAVRIKDETNIVWLTFDQKEEISYSMIMTKVKHTMYSPYLFVKQVAQQVVRVKNGEADPDRRRMINFVYKEGKEVARLFLLSVVRENH